ncbi:MAG: hypothetical protein WAM82_29155 [Thermoanaerobaculia bacterium]
MANSLNITAVDNELILVAYQWGASFEICTILSGNSNSVNVTLNVTPGAYQGGITLNGVNNSLSGTYPINLASGTYSLAVIGINWGGPQQFSFTFNNQTYSLPYSPTGGGVVWDPPVISFTVPASS